MKLSAKTSPRYSKRWSNIAKRVMTLGLIVFCAGCASTSRQLPLPSVAESPSGNAILTTLPAGTLVTLPSRELCAQMESLLVNEVQRAGDEGLTLRLCTPLKLATIAYLKERDAALAAALLLHEQE